MTSYVQKSIRIESLVVFRISFGSILFLLTFRTLIYGWVDKFYIQPDFFFKFYGFYWIEPLPAEGMYILFLGMLIASIFIVLGLWYKWAVGFFFISFVYTELLDLTHYLNHYYLVSILLFLSLFLPANRAYALDVWKSPQKKYTHAPKWTVDILRLQLVIVYFYSGIAKLHSDWLAEAQPMRIWLGQRTDLPLLGTWFGKIWLAYFLSWAGMIYDLSIGFFLCWKPSRIWAYFTVILFHVLTALLFNIGVFPYLMILSTLIFFSGQVHQKIITTFAVVFNFTLSKLKQGPKKRQVSKTRMRLLACILVPFFILQCLIPLRHHLYKGHVLWTEEGFRFAWNVMVVEKRGTVQFRVVDAVSNQESLVNNLDYLTEKQEFMMGTQADFILQFAHFLSQEYRENHGYMDAMVFVDAQVSLNGRISQRFIDPTVDLAKEKPSLLAQQWILPFD